MILVGTGKTLVAKRLSPMPTKWNYRYQRLEVVYNNIELESRRPIFSTGTFKCAILKTHFSLSEQKYFATPRVWDSTTGHKCSRLRYNLK